MKKRIMPILLQDGQTETTGFLAADLNIKVKNRIEIFFTFKTDIINADFQALKASKTGLTLTFGKSVFTDQIIQDFEVKEDLIKIHTIANRDKLAKDFDKW